MHLVNFETTLLRYLGHAWHLDRRLAHLEADTAVQDRFLHERMGLEDHDAQWSMYVGHRRRMLPTHGSYRLWGRAETIGA